MTADLVTNSRPSGTSGRYISRKEGSTESFDHPGVTRVTGGECEFVAFFSLRFKTHRTIDYGSHKIRSDDLPELQQVSGSTPVRGHGIEDKHLR